jgi:hypothetical protein
MMTPAAAAPDPTMASFNPVMPPEQPPGVTANGTDNTQKIQRFTTPIKLEFIIPASQTAFNLAKTHKEIMKLLKDKDPTLEIIPSKAGNATFKDLVNFPANEKDYNDQFDHAVQKEATEARRIIVAHSLLTSFKFSDLKFQNAKLMEHMCKNKVCIRHNQSESFAVAALGWIQDVHPRTTFRDHFRHNLSEAIRLEMTESEQAQLNKLLPEPKTSDADEEQQKRSVLRHRASPAPSPRKS